VDFVIRTVPTFLTITEYKNLIDYCLEQNLLLNSYFITTRDWQAIEILPDDIRQKLQAEFIQQLAVYEQKVNPDLVRLNNYRNKTQVLDNLIQEIKACIKSLDATSNPDIDLLRTTATKKLKELDSLRGNSVINSFPVLADFFRQYDY
tara:strand:+ start:543 stop:986 length:444 start_codon:yes stop_codon:yes gene_type:complete